MRKGTHARTVWRALSRRIFSPSRSRDLRRRPLLWSSLRVVKS